MKTINQDLHRLLEVLRRGDAVCDRDYFVLSLLRRLFTNKEQRQLTVAKRLIDLLDQLEAIPIVFDVSQPIDYAPYVAAIEEVLGVLSTSRTPEAFDVSFQLLRRLTALRYRLEGVNGGHDTVPPDIDEIIFLRRQVREWKEQQPLIPNKELSDTELECIKETVSYSHFLPLIACDDALRESFFIWTIRDKMSPIAFIQYPAMQEKITATSLAGRIGRINGGFLKIKKVTTDHGIQKIMTLPVEGKEINILDETIAHTFRGNYTLTVGEIFEIFANKFAKAGNIELLAEGIINWNYLKMGWYDADNDCHHLVNVKKPGWWKQLPIFEIISLEQARERFGDHVDGKNWNVSAAASRGSATLDYERTHAYLDFAIPIGNGEYAIYDFGKFANEFPTNMKETLNMFAMNVHASVAYPDESVYYSHREHAYYSFPMTPEQGFKCMESITEDILIARDSNFVYQIESDNCAKWAQEKIVAGIGEDHMPNLFQMHLLATEPAGPVSHLFSFIRKLPQSIRTYVLTRLHLPLGAHCGTWINENGQTVCKSLSRHEFFETGIVYLPAYLHRQQEMGLIGCVIDCFETIIYQAATAIVRPFVSFAKRMFEIFGVDIAGFNDQNVLLAKLINVRKNSQRHHLSRYDE